MGNPFRVCVVGGSNMDLVATSFAAVRDCDSNPGKLTLNPGGVGRNIAENLQHLGVETHLITVFGDDPFGEQIRASCRSSGMDLAGSAVYPGIRSGTYLCLNEPDGSLYAAVSDMDACDAVTPAFLAERQAILDRADLVVAEANLPEESLRWLAEHCKAPLAMDPVSVPKSSRLISVLPRLTLIKPNLSEARALTGCEGPQEAAEALHRLGIPCVLVSLGANGIWYCGAEGEACQPCIPASVINTNGCGDACFAACIRAYLEGMDLCAIARMGQAAASLSAEYAGTVSPHLNWSGVLARAAEAI